MSTPPLLQVQGLTVRLALPGGPVDAVRALTFTLEAGRTLALVGESGCGKSLTALALMQLLPRRVARIATGSVRLAGTELTTLPEPAMRALRGDRIAMIFQEPMTSLNPVLTIGRQVGEVLQLHRGLTRHQADTQTLALLERVRVPDARRRLGQYPHQLSGGMRQRVMIAMALACRPQLLIADEPTTALDVTIQAQILALLDEVRHETGSAVLLITHDLGVVAEVADEVAVLYAGRAVEQADTTTLFTAPCHPYTRGLMGSVPRLVLAPGGAAAPARLTEIAGTVPPLADMPPGCAFAPRCAKASAQCTADPPLREPAGGHRVACWHPVHTTPRAEVVV